MFSSLSFCCFSFWVYLESLSIQMKIVAYIVPLILVGLDKEKLAYILLLYYLPARLVLTSFLVPGFSA